jgi:hypothetical protein
VILSVLLASCSKKFIGCYSATSSGAVNKHEYIYVVETDSGFNFIGAANYLLEKPIMSLGTKYESRISRDTVEVKIQDGIEYASVLGEYHLNSRLNLHLDSTKMYSTSISCEPIFVNWGNYFSRDLQKLSYYDVVSTDSSKIVWSPEQDFSMNIRLFEIENISGFIEKVGSGYLFVDTKTGLFIEGMIDTQAMNKMTYTFDMVDFGYYRRHKYKKIMKDIMSIDIETRGDNIWRQWNVSFNK